MEMNGGFLVTKIKQLGDQDLREWEEPVPEYDGSVSERKKRKSFSRIIITAVTFP